jgi:hypothetical protein
MAGGCSVEPGALIPWLVRPRQRWKAAEADGRGTPLFQADRGRRGRGGLSGLKGRTSWQGGWADWARN